jgi:hypothetical protein
VIYGLPESPVRNVILKHVHITAKLGLDMQYADVTATDLVLDIADGTAITTGPGSTLVMN